MSERILVVDDEEILRENLCDFLSGSGFEVDSAADGQAAWELLELRDYDVVLTDLRMPRMDGIALLRRVAAELPETLVLVMTAYASVDTAVQALRLGAFDYILKPIAFEELLQKIRNVVQLGRLQSEVKRLRAQVHQQGDFEGIIGDSQTMQRVFELIERVGPTPTTVLITGDSGTGKELVARALHAKSEVAELPFMAVNVAAIPGETLESQLFGHTRGAFTGAVRERDGILRAARGGTVFLDEIGELPLNHQAKLLRALETHEVLPVGADQPVKANFRLLAATNQNLEEAVAQGRFREDLFYRLNVFRIALPALRERGGDVALLVAYFLRFHGSRLRRVGVPVTNAGMRLLTAYAWPGNVRELSNVIERALILGGDQISVEHLPNELQRQESKPLALKDAVSAAEASHIRWVLSIVGGDRDAAAQKLEIDRATLYRRLKKHGIT